MKYMQKFCLTFHSNLLFFIISMNILFIWIKNVIKFNTLYITLCCPAPPPLLSMAHMESAIDDSAGLQTNYHKPNTLLAPRSRIIQKLVRNTEQLRQVNTGKTLFEPFRATILRSEAASKQKRKMKAENPILNPSIGTR